MAVTQKHIRVGVNHIVNTCRSDLIRLQRLLADGDSYGDSLKNSAVIQMMRDEARRARWQLHGLDWAAELGSRLHQEIGALRDHIGDMEALAKKGELK